MQQIAIVFIAVAGFGISLHFAGGLNYSQRIQSNENTVLAMQDVASADDFSTLNCQVRRARENLSDARVTHRQAAALFLSGRGTERAALDAEKNLEAATLMLARARFSQTEAHAAFEPVTGSHSKSC